MEDWVWKDVNSIIKDQVLTEFEQENNIIIKDELLCRERTLL